MVKYYHTLGDERAKGMIIAVQLLKKGDFEILTI